MLAHQDDQDDRWICIRLWLCDGRSMEAISMFLLSLRLAYVDKRFRTSAYAPSFLATCVVPILVLSFSNLVTMASEQPPASEWVKESTELSVSHSGDLKEDTQRKQTHRGLFIILDLFTASWGLMPTEFFPSCLM